MFLFWVEDYWKGKDEQNCVLSSIHTQEISKGEEGIEWDKESKIIKEKFVFVAGGRRQIAADSLYILITDTPSCLFSPSFLLPSFCELASSPSFRFLILSLILLLYSSQTWLYIFFKSIEPKMYLKWWLVGLNISEWYRCILDKASPPCPLSDNYHH